MNAIDNQSHIHSYVATRAGEFDQLMAGVGALAHPIPVFERVGVPEDQQELQREKSQTMFTHVYQILSAAGVMLEADAGYSSVETDVVDGLVVMHVRNQIGAQSTYDFSNDENGRLQWGLTNYEKDGTAKQVEVQDVIFQRALNLLSELASTGTVN